MEIDPTTMGTVALIATFLVPLVSLIKKPTWSRQAKYALGLAAALLSTIIGAVINGDIGSVSEFVAYLSTGLASAQTVYNLYFVDTDVNESLEQRDLF